MKAYTTLYDDVLPEIAGIEPALALHHIKRACSDFYARSLYGRDALAAINVTAGVSTYTLTPTDPVNFAVGSVQEVRLYDGSNGGTPYQLAPRSPSQLNADMPDWDKRAGTITYYAQRAAGALTLAYVPSQDYVTGLLVSIATVPLYEGGGVDDAVFDRFGDALAAGAKARLMRMGKKPWSDAAGAARYGAFFEQEIAAAAAIAAKSFGSAPLRTRAFA